ncbi:MAG: phosphate ABC transporter ATP-binding protein PstB [Thaumarchaeota archaeon]|nr:phosphate ABC transporter ATP-binding protein PstB [Nitrososphaerota archaeon]
MKHENTARSTRITISSLNVFYGQLHVLKDVSLEFEERKISVIMGPSGCGKSTLIRVLNRMNDEVEGFRLTGKVQIGGKDIYDKDVDPVLLKTRVGMVFQKPNPFPISIYENVAFGPKIHKMYKSKQELDDIVRDSLEKAALWDEVKDRLKENAMKLSGGQQQRLCIARSLAVRPQVLLLDEPASALDPGSTSKIEELMVDLKRNYTIVLVTHNMQQAARVASKVAFLYKGEVIEFRDSPDIFERPSNDLTEKYIRGELV